MSRTEDEERTPLVYEDRVGSSSGIETEGSRRRRRYICIGLTTVCLGVGLVLAVALPITLSQGKTTDTKPLALYAQRFNKSETTLDLDNDYSRHTTPETHTTSSSSGTKSPSFSSLFFPDYSPSNSSSTFSPLFPTRSWPLFPTRSWPLFPTRPTPGPFGWCPWVPKGRRYPIGLDELNGKILFELYRVQTPNSPAFSPDISCSTMELDVPSSTNETSSADGTMKLKWLESGFISRYPKAVDVKLEGSSESAYDWKEIFGNDSSGLGKLSLLVQIDGYLLTYECFPDVVFYPRPAYAIHLYSLLPVRGESTISTVLLHLANIWGLNPAQERVIPISHRYCPQDAASS